MATVEVNENTFQLGSATIEDVLNSRVTKKNLKSYFDEVKYKSNSSKSKLDQVYFYLQERPKDLAQLKTFFAKSIMFGKSRIVTESFIANSPSPAYHVDTLLDRLGVESLEDYCTNLLDNFVPSQVFQPVYRDVIAEKNDINAINIIYTRLFRNRKAKGDITRAEYVWFELNLQEKRFRLHFTNDKTNEVDSDLPSNSKNLFAFFSRILNRQFDIALDLQNEKKVVYTIYHTLTEQNERSYAVKVKPYLSDIEEFYSEMLNNLGMSSQDDTVDGKYRIEKLFVRMLISQNFNDFLNTKTAEGRVKAFSFENNGNGTRLNASSGATRDTTNDMMTYIETSDAYFDNKETIDKAKALFSVLVQWNPGFDDIKDIMQVRYSAFDGFLETHFLYTPVKEEEYGIELRKIDRIRERSRSNN